MAKVKTQKQLRAELDAAFDLAVKVMQEYQSALSRVNKRGRSVVLRDALEEIVTISNEVDSLRALIAQRKGD